MMKEAQQSITSAVQEFLRRAITRTAGPEGVAWLHKVIRQAEEGLRERDLYLAFSMAPRIIGKQMLHLSDEEREEATRLRPGWQPGRWSADQAARVLVLLSIPRQDPPVFKTILATLFSSAEMGELVALYSSLPLLPFPEEFRDRAAEGIRTNMAVVFDAVALDNPYPAEYLSEPAWNQMVLKAIFIARPLCRIYKLDERRNPALARMVSDYAHERWAASRTVTPEAWRLVAPFLAGNPVLVADMKRVLEDQNPLQRAAAALALQGVGSTLRASHPDLYTKLEKGEFTWLSIADAWYSAQS